MTQDEINEYYGFYKLEPWGTEVEDTRFGRLIHYQTGVAPEVAFPGWFEEEIEDTLDDYRSRKAMKALGGGD